MSAMDTEAARIKRIVHEWAERVKRGEKAVYGFDARGEDLGKGKDNG